MQIRDLRVQLIFWQNTFYICNTRGSFSRARGFETCPIDPLRRFRYKGVTLRICRTRSHRHPYLVSARWRPSNHRFSDLAVIRQALLVFKLFLARHHYSPAVFGLLFVGLVLSERQLTFSKGLKSDAGFAGGCTSPVHKPWLHLCREVSWLMPLCFMAVELYNKCKHCPQRKNGRHERLTIKG